MKAPSLAMRNDAWGDLVRRAMPDVQDAFLDYDVRLELMSRPSRESQEELEKAHDLDLHDGGRTKSELLRRHDLEALGHLQARCMQHQESWVFLTWDKSMIRLAAANLSRSWVVSPEIAMDFAQPCRKLSQTQWCTLAHRLARVSDPRESLTAKIIDQVTRLRHERLQDWEFKQDIRNFREEAFSRLPVGQDADYHAWVEAEAAAFLNVHEISPIKSDNTNVNEGNA